MGFMHTWLQVWHVCAKPNFSGLWTDTRSCRNYTLILMTSLILSDITIGTSAAHKELPRDNSKAEETHPRVSVTGTGVASYLCAMGRTMFPLAKMEVEFWSAHNQFLYVSSHPFSTHTRVYVVRIHATPLYHDWRQIPTFDHKMALKTNDCKKKLIAKRLHRPWCEIPFQGDTVGRMACCHWCQWSWHRPPW